MKQFIKKNFKLMFSAVLSVMLFAFACIGINNVKKVSAEETVYEFGELVLESPELPTDVEIVWSEVSNGDKLAGHYVAMVEGTIMSFNNFPCTVYSNNKIGVFSGDIIYITSQTSTEVVSGVTYYVVYVEPEFNEMYTIKINEENTDEFTIDINSETTFYIEYSDAPVYKFAYNPSDETVEPEEPETPDEPEVEVINIYDTMFFLPDMYDKSNWVESEITATSDYKDSYGGKWFRWKKPETSESTHAFNLQMSINDELKTQGLSFNLDTEKITFGRYSVEYQLKEYHGELYLEFYLPELFDKTVCYANNLSTEYHDYFDNTYLISYKNSKADIVFITAPEGEEEPEQGGVSGGLWDKFDGEDGELSFVEKVGEMVSSWFNVEDANYNVWGWVSLVLSGLVVVGILALIFKLK